jgi:hypothetical protein
MSFRLTTTTQDKIMAMVADGVFNSNVLFSRLARNRKKFVGERMKFPIEISSNGNNGSFSGADVFSKTIVDTRRNMEYVPKFFYQSVTLPLTDLWVNSTSETQIINLMDIEVKWAAQSAADALGTIFYGDGTGNGGKDFNGLGNLVDDGTVSATIGGLTRASFPDALDSVVTASGGTLTLSKIRSLYDGVRSGNTKPTLGVTDESTFSLIDQLLEQKARYNEVNTDAKKPANFGFGADTINFRTVDIIADEKCTAGSLFFLNENFLGWYALQDAPTSMGLRAVPYAGAPIEGNDYQQLPGIGFFYTGFTKSQNQAVYSADIYVGGEFLTNLPKRQGKLTGITGV